MADDIDSTSENEVKINKQKVLSLTKEFRKPAPSKTMFKAPASSFEFIAEFGRILNSSTRESIEIIVKFAAGALKKNEVEFCELPPDSIRKSVAISEEAKKKLKDVAKERKRSRDEVFYSFIKHVREQVMPKALTLTEKLDCARDIEKIAGEMLEIAENSDFEKLVAKLEDSGDPDFADCADMYAYQVLLSFYTNIEIYINKKEEEANGETA